MSQHEALVCLFTVLLCLFLFRVNVPHSSHSHPPHRPCPAHWVLPPFSEREKTTIPAHAEP